MPLNVMMELTWRCGAACSFCYLGRTGRLNARGPEMSTAEVKAFIRRFEPGTRFYFTGGEPFLRRDIFSILSFVSERGFSWGVNTNGLCLDAVRIKRLAALRPAYVIFSLHGTAALHDRLAGVKGAHGKVLGSIKAAVRSRAPGTEIITNCVISADNAAALPAVYLEAARAGADRAVFEHLQFLKTGEDAGPDAGSVMTPVLDSYSLEVPVLERSLKKMRALRGAFKTHLELRPDFSRRELERYYNGWPRPSGACPGLLSTINLEPDGGIRTCVLNCGRASSAKRFNAGEVMKAKRRLVRGGLPRFCARCCHRFPIERVF